MTTQAKYRTLARLQVHAINEQYEYPPEWDDPDFSEYLSSDIEVMEKVGSEIAKKVFGETAKLETETTWEDDTRRMNRSGPAKVISAEIVAEGKSQFTSDNLVISDLKEIEKVIEASIKHGYRNQVRNIKFYSGNGDGQDFTIEVEFNPRMYESRDGYLMVDYDEKNVVKIEFKMKATIDNDPY